MTDQGVVTGIGGVFVKSQNTDSLVKWYRDVLGFPFDGYGSSFPMREHDNPEEEGYNVWGPFKADTDYFAPSDKDFMINLRVRNLDALMDRLLEAGVKEVKPRESHDYGNFAWIVDPDGTKLELWEQVGGIPEVNPEEKLDGE